MTYVHTATPASIKDLLSDVLKKEKKADDDDVPYHVHVLFTRAARRISFARLPERQQTGGMLAVPILSKFEGVFSAELPYWG
jgi:hypothetical protein